MAYMRPYLMFAGNCKEAMNFYKDCIGGELVLLPVGESQMRSEDPRSNEMIMHGALTKGNFVLYASDMMGSEGVINGNTVSLCLEGETKGEIEEAFVKLSAGATIGHELKEEFFGTFGDLKDKYGMNWMFQYSPQEK